MSEKKPIEKKILHNGLPGHTPGYVEGTKVNFHFLTRRISDGHVLDDSRKWTRPMELVLGKKFRLEVWETCIQTMVVNEVSRFTVKKQLTLNYPTVLKTLRDNFRVDKKEDGKKKSNGHMCSMMAMQMEGGLGYDDLNVLMKSPSDLEFTLELLKVVSPSEYEKENWQMDIEEKEAKLPVLKEKGNALFKETQYDEAALKYAEAITLLDQLMLREKPHDEEWLALRSRKVTYLLNFAQCKLNTREFYAAIEACDEALDIDPDNVKGHFRRGRAHSGSWAPDAAMRDFERALALDPSLTHLCKKELAELEVMRRKKDEEDRKCLKSLF